MSLESELRDEYMASDFLSGSAGYRDFFVAKIKEMQAKVEALEKDNYSLRNKISLMVWERERARHQEITDGYRQAAQEQDDE